MKRSYYKDHLLNIIKDEDLDKDILMDILKYILENSILSMSTEDLEYNLRLEE